MSTIIVGGWRWVVQRDRYAAGQQDRYAAGRRNRYAAGRRNRYAAGRRNRYAAVASQLAATRQVTM